MSAPYPPSPVIESVEWDPPEQIVRQARGRGRDGSDNWPLTWAADGYQYTAYGDGYGFDPIVPEKLGLGFARLQGGPGDFRAENIRSDGENREMGPRGRKASGLLAAGGRFYMWARNADGAGKSAQLAWSEDGARTWAWAEWRWEGFGYPTFINFGPGYSGVPRELGEYVYVVSHDGPSAYEAADGFVLLRAPLQGLRERDAYAFFAGVDAAGRPRWSADIQERRPVFEHQGACLRSGLTYNAGLGRYLWWQQVPSQEANTRFAGGFGLYDAPQPWGPWTTVYFTRSWDVGPGETGSFPTHWMSADGKTCHLVFSGDDNFAVRRALLRTRS